MRQLSLKCLKNRQPSVCFSDTKGARVSKRLRPILQACNFSPTIRPMTHLIRLESVNGEPQIGAFAIEFPSKTCKALQWRSEAPIADTLGAAKEYAAKALQTCLDEQRQDDAERTYWASVTAAIQAIIKQWNEKLREHLYARDTSNHSAAASAPSAGLRGSPRRRTRGRKGRRLHPQHGCANLAQPGIRSPLSRARAPRHLG